MKSLFHEEKQFLYVLTRVEEKRIANVENITRDESLPRLDRLFYTNIKISVDMKAFEFIAFIPSVATRHISDSFKPSRCLKQTVSILYFSRANRRRVLMFISSCINEISDRSSG